MSSKLTREPITVLLSIEREAMDRKAAMDSEPVELPLDYLQGHKDGLEWAAQLAKANHPETGDWLYDDPIELAKVIRKGPDMPPAQPVADSEPERNPVLAYADSYRDMAKQGVESVPIWSVITDLERNIAPLYRHAQPAKGLELAGWQFKSVNGDWLGLIDEHGKNQAVRDGYEVREVFAMADGVNERDQVRREHAEWSQATFGNVGPVGPLKHLSKEALEAAAEPDDLSEWADMQFLMWDAQRRAGITDEQITKAMIEKLVVNKHREWPEPKEGEPRLHIKEQPAPVVPEKATVGEMPFLGTSEGAYVRGWNDCRAAMLQAGNSPVIPGAKQRIADAVELLKQAAPAMLADNSGPDGPLAGRMKSPVIPEGYVMVPKEPTKEMIDAGWLHFMGTKNPSSKGTYKAMLAAAPQEVKGE